jgi:hypothetical protein
LKNFEYAFGENLAALFCLGLQDREDQILLAKTTGIFDVHLSGHFGQPWHRLRLKLTNNDRFRTVVELGIKRGFFLSQLRIARQVVALRFAAATTTATVAAIAATDDPDRVDCDSAGILRRLSSRVRGARYSRGISLLIECLIVLGIFISGILKVVRGI